MQSSLQISSFSPTGAETSHGQVTAFSFPGGERHIRIPQSAIDSTDRSWSVDARLYTAEAAIDLMLLADALRRAVPAGSLVHLHLPYVPYARQDRVAVRGEALSAAVFCQLINSLEFSSVSISDPHSDVTPALLKKVDVTPAATYVEQLRRGALASAKEVAVVAPDAGARKRAEQAAAAIGAPLVMASKKRDPLTGNLSGATIEGSVPDMPLLVVDDICDGGGTFIALAQELRKHTSQPLYLYVTHGLFTKGLSPLLALYDGVFTPFCAQPELASQTSIQSTAR